MPKKYWSHLTEMAGRLDDRPYAKDAARGATQKMEE
jgi:hypothetical protein